MSNGFLIYVDGNRQIGYGHLTRMRSLCDLVGLPYQILTRTPEATSKIFDAPETNIQTIQSKEQIVDYARLHAATLVVLDPPYSEARADELTGPFWQPVVDALKGVGKRVVRFIDESRATDHRCDLLINDHPCAWRFVGEYSEMGFDGKLLAGAEHFLIDDRHRNLSTPNFGEQRSLFISFGGSDQCGLVDRLMPLIQELGRQLAVHMVVGPGHPTPLPHNCGIKISKGLSPRAFATELRKCKLAFTASGNTIFERAYHRVPGLSISQSPHQETIGQAFDDLGITRHLGAGSKVDLDILARSVIDLWEDAAACQTQRTHCENLDIEAGCREIVEAVRSLA